MPMIYSTRIALVVLLALALPFTGAGCSTTRPIAQRGIGIYENTNRSYWVRVPAALGAFLGANVGLPFAILLFPSYPFEDLSASGIREPEPQGGGSAGPVVVDGGASSDGDDASTGPSQLKDTLDSFAEGDYTVPLARVPIDYGIGVGAWLLGTPCASIEDAVSGPRAPDPAWRQEQWEELPAD
ncbi:MAG: hypothetical protein MK538_12070 [Planctomycetes bacterium]|nr:hypothetical protein [Planctomycetota bacterium]